MTVSAPSSSVEQTGPNRQIKLLFGGLMVTMLLASLNQTVLSTALPTIVGELNGVDHMTWVVTSYIVSSTIMMPVYGKLSDLFGRKQMLIAAIVLFLIGSVIAGLAGSIELLIAGRVVQGLGGGGLIILSQAAIADVVPARDRGKYMGAMGGVFALASVAGPLLGGWFTEGPGWRWAFWINIPLGILAILAAVLLMKLPKVVNATRVRVDYLGMILMAVATTALVLVATWGGSEYDWTSPQIIGLIATALVTGAAFVLVEAKASEPIIPLTLFKDRNFNLTTIASLAIGVMMFGAVGYMPTYLQMVTGATATEAGLLMIPMMGGLLLASMVSGQIVSRTGRYKLFPIVGSLITGVGLALLSTLKVDSPTPLILGYLGVLGIGVGLAMQLLVLIVQNSFPISQVGTATAATNYFRQVGATLGSAAVGSVFVSRLASLLSERLPQNAGSGSSSNSFTPAVVHALPDAIRLPIIESYNEALLPIFLVMVPLAVISAVVLCFVVEKPLATAIKREIPSESLAEGQLDFQYIGDDADVDASDTGRRSPRGDLQTSGRPRS